MKNLEPLHACRINGNKINWNQVFYFYQIALCGSIKDAALRLEVTNSTLSEHLRQLEDDLGVALFFRHHRKLMPTPQGSRLFQQAKQMFEAGQRLIDVLSPFPLGCYPISVGMVPGPSSLIVYPLLSKFVSEFGPLSIRFLQASQEKLEKDLLDAVIDFGFSDEQVHRKDIVATKVTSSPLGLYISSKLKKRSLSEAFETLPLLHPSQSATAKSFVDQLLDEVDVTPKATITADFTGFLITLCEGGEGIGVFSEAVANSRGKALQPLRLPATKVNIQDTLYVLWAKDAENSEAITRIKDTLLNQSSKSH